MKDARRFRMYEERANWCAEVYLAKLPKGEVVAVLARQRGLAHTDTGSILLIRSTDGCRTWGPDPVVVFPTRSTGAKTRRPSRGCRTEA